MTRYQPRWASALARFSTLDNAMRRIFPALYISIPGQSNSLQERENAERQENRRRQESARGHHEPRVHCRGRQPQISDPSRLPVQSSTAAQTAPLRRTETIDWSSNSGTYPARPRHDSTELKEAFKRVAPTKSTYRKAPPLTEGARAEAEIVAATERVQIYIDGGGCPVPVSPRPANYDMPRMRAGLEKALNWARPTNPDIEERLKEADWEALTQMMRLALLDEVQRNIDVKAFPPSSHLEPFTDFNTTFAMQVVVKLCLLLEAQGMPSTVVQMRAQVLQQGDPEVTIPPLDGRLSKCLLLLSLRVHDRHRHANSCLQEFHDRLTASGQTSG